MSRWGHLLLAATAAAAIVASSAIGAKAAWHVWMTSQMGAICGSGASLHCWACFAAAPSVVAAGLLVWLAARVGARASGEAQPWVGSVDRLEVQK